MVAHQPLQGALVKVKQGVDLHTSTLGQALAAVYLEGGHSRAHLPKIIDLYRPHQAAMLAALARHFPSNFTWSRPEGGMFVWAEGPTGLDMDRVYWKAVERQTAFVLGKFFYTEPGVELATLRLNFTMAKPAAIKRAVAILAAVVDEVLATKEGERHTVSGSVSAKDTAMSAF
jgi:2-aminoadipate transaminase